MSFPEGQDLYAYNLLGALGLVIPRSSPVKLVVRVVIVQILVKENGATER